LSKDDKILYRKLHWAVKKITDDTVNFHFNTAIAAVYELVNLIYKAKERGKVTEPVMASTLETLIILLAPFTPHLSEELWHQIGKEGSVFHQPWPSCDPKALVKEEVTYAVQINGKVRGEVTVPADADNEFIKEKAFENPKVAKWIEGKTVHKVIVIPGKLVSIVIK